MVVTSHGGSPRLLGQRSFGAMKSRGQGRQAPGGVRGAHQPYSVLPSAYRRLKAWYLMALKKMFLSPVRQSPQAT